jgi:carboxypeptidase Taq
MKEYFGIEVPSDTLGVLQDVHWSAGLIGYFPTYSFGNLYSAQFFNSMKKDIQDIDKKISEGKFEEIREWLRKHIHMHGKTYTAGNLVKKVTGENLSSSYFIEYLKEKYNNIY